MITFSPTYIHICCLIEACQHDEVANQERETSNWIVNIKGIVTHFYGIANDEAMTNKKMRKKGCSSLQKKTSSLVSVTHSGVHLLILGMEVMLYLDSLQRELQISRAMLQCTYQIVCCRFRGTYMSQRGQNTRR